MAQQKTNFITHTFGGGWATDFGPTYYGAPDQGGQFKIPCPYRSGLRGGYTSGSSFDQGRS